MAKRHFSLKIYDVIGLMISNLLETSRTFKTLIALLIDVSIVYIAIILAFYLRLGNFEYVPKIYDQFSLTCISIFLPLWLYNKIYNHILRMSGFGTYKRFLKLIIFYSIILVLARFVYDYEFLPRTIILIQPFILFTLLIFWRYVSQKLIFYFSGVSAIKHKQRSNILLFGSGQSAREIIQTLQSSNKYTIIGILDESVSNQGQYLDNIKIFSLTKIEALKKKFEIDLILIIGDQFEKVEYRKIRKNLEKYNIPIKIIPKPDKYLTDLLNQFEENKIHIEDLLERKEVFEIDKSSINKTTNDIILITGGGGSIGRELAIQIYKMGVKKILLLDQNEYGLYQTSETINKIKDIYKIKEERVELILGSVLDINHLSMIMKKYKPNIIYHAAAYKHVPLVESNPIQAITNNIIGTKNLVEISSKNQIEKFILISSDKAVRPANIMGMTKRISELLVQAFATKKNKTKFMIVRFGNVLDSSGSVIPKFRDQIKLGGPITVTHPEIIRYFMTIPEAVNLVISASKIGKSGEVFVLDMGPPVKILDLAKRMIRLESHNSTDLKQDKVEIVFTGLRPGEKLYEELMISNNIHKTEINKLQKVQEPFIEINQLKIFFKILEKYIKERNEDKLIKHIKTIIEK